MWHAVMMGFAKGSTHPTASQLEPPRDARYGRPNIEAGENKMKQIRIGDITVDAVIEREGPWRRPQDFFPAYDDATFRRHLPTMEPEVFDPVLGMMLITYQTFVVRTPHHTILVDTCTGEDKGHPPPFDFPGKERWRKEL